MHCQNTDINLNIFSRTVDPNCPLCQLQALSYVTACVSAVEPLRQTVMQETRFVVVVLGFYVP